MIQVPTMAVVVCAELGSVFNAVKIHFLSYLKNSYREHENPMSMLRLFVFHLSLAQPFFHLLLHRRVFGRYDRLSWESRARPSTSLICLTYVNPVDKTK